MRIYLAVAAILAFGIEAHGQDIGKRCLAEAAAKGLYGQERMHFQARCKAGTIAKGPPAPPSVTSRAKTTITNRYPRWEHKNGYHRCVDSLASLIIGACPTCVPLWPLEDGHCVDQ